jgi:hypothetical protein
MSRLRHSGISQHAEGELGVVHHWGHQQTARIPVAALQKGSSELSTIEVTIKCEDPSHHPCAHACSTFSSADTDGSESGMTSKHWHRSIDIPDS